MPEPSKKAVSSDFNCSVLEDVNNRKPENSPVDPPTFNAPVQGVGE